MSDRVAIMNDGVIEQCGTPEDVYEHPTSVFAAGFIGTSNLMSGTWSAAAAWSSRPTVSDPGAGPPGLGRGRRGQRRGPAREDLDQRPHAGDGPGARHDRVDQLPRRHHAVPRLGRARRSPSPSSSRTSRGCGPRTGGAPATGSRSAGCPSTPWCSGDPPRTSSSSAPGWPAWPPRATSRPAAPRSPCWRPGTGSAAASSRSSSPTAGWSSSAARWSATPTRATSGWSRSSASPSTASYVAEPGEITRQVARLASTSATGRPGPRDADRASYDEVEAALEKVRGLDRPRRPVRSPRPAAGSTGSASATGCARSGATPGVLRLRELRPPRASPTGRSSGRACSPTPARSPSAAAPAATTSSEWENLRVAEGSATVALTDGGGARATCACRRRCARDRGRPVRQRRSRRVDGEALRADAVVLAVPSGPARDLDDRRASARPG